MTNSKNYLLALLASILAFNFVDRFALGVLLQDIKVDFNLSDTQLGLLTGLAFAVFYSIMGIPIARWADRGNRVTIISVTTALWSVAVMLCGMAGSFGQLLLIRVGIAVGEAGCIPPAHSLIADHFTRAERPRAVSRYMLGTPLAILIGYFAAGWLNEFYGWRMTFVLLGIPGLVLAVLAAVTLKEPRRTNMAPATEASEASPGAPDLRETFVTLWANRAYRHLLLCFSVWGFFGYGIMQWQPAFFARSYGLSTGEMGTWFSLVCGLGGILGVLLGGELITRYATNNESLQLKAIAVVYSILAVIGTGIYLAPSYHLAFVVLAISTIVAAATNGPMFAVIQTLVPSHMRAVSIALMYFFCNLIGMGLGPLAVGLLSDSLRPWLGEESLRYALLMFSPGYLWCTWHLWQASRVAHKAMEQVDEKSMRAPSTRVAVASSTIFDSGRS